MENKINKGVIKMAIDLLNVKSTTLKISEDTEIDNVDFIQNLSQKRARVSESVDFSDTNEGFFLNAFDGYRSATNKIFIKPYINGETIIIQAKGKDQ